MGRLSDELEAWDAGHGEAEDIEEAAQAPPGADAPKRRSLTEELEEWEAKKTSGDKGKMTHGEAFTTALANPLGQGHRISGLIQAAGGRVFAGDERPFREQYEQYRDEEKARQKKASNDSLVGSIGGQLVADLPATFGVGALLRAAPVVGGVMSSASKAKGIGGAAARTGVGAAEGALYSGIATDFDPTSMALGGGFGGAFAGAGEGIKAVANTRNKAVEAARVGVADPLRKGIKAGEIRDTVPALQGQADDAAEAIASVRRRLQEFNATPADHGPGAILRAKAARLAESKARLYGDDVVKLDKELAQLKFKLDEELAAIRPAQERLSAAKSNISDTQVPKAEIKAEWGEKNAKGIDHILKNSDEVIPRNQAVRAQEREIARIQEAIAGGEGGGTFVPTKRVFTAPPKKNDPLGGKSVDDVIDSIDDKTLNAYASQFDDAYHTSLTSADKSVVAKLQGGTQADRPSMRRQKPPGEPHEPDFSPWVAEMRRQAEEAAPLAGQLAAGEKKLPILRASARRAKIKRRTDPEAQKNWVAKKGDALRAQAADAPILKAKAGAAKAQAEVDKALAEKVAPIKTKIAENKADKARSPERGARIDARIKQLEEEAKKAGEVAKKAGEAKEAARRQILDELKAAKDTSSTAAKSIKTAEREAQRLTAEMNSELAHPHRYVPWAMPKTKLTLMLGRKHLSSNPERAKAIVSAIDRHAARSPTFARASESVRRIADRQGPLAALEAHNAKLSSDEAYAAQMRAADEEGEEAPVRSAPEKAGPALVPSTYPDVDVQLNRRARDRLDAALDDLRPDLRSRVAKAITSSYRSPEKQKAMIDSWEKGDREGMFEPPSKTSLHPHGGAIDVSGLPKADLDKLDKVMRAQGFKVLSHGRSRHYEMK